MKNLKKVCIDKTIQAKDPEYEDWCLYEYWRSHKQIDKGKVIQINANSIRNFL
jgi:hypothetical protein